MSQQLESPPLISAGEVVDFEVCATFRNPKADLTVISSDNVEFHVYKNFLAEASPVFGDMFDHPQPPSGPSDTLPWPEPAATIDCLLRFIYPIPKPSIETAEHCLSLLEAADKWEIEVAISLLRKDMVQEKFLASHALKIYAFASHMGFEEERKLALDKARQCDPCHPSIRDQVASMTALDLLALVHLRAGLSPHYLERLPPPGIPSTTDFFSDELFQREADLALDSIDNYRFWICKEIVRAASPILRKMIDDLNSQSVSESTSFFVLSLPESGWVIQDLLLLIYPIRKPEKHRTLDDITHLMTVAMKYQIDVAVWHLTQQLVSDHHLHSRPLRVYGFACLMGLDEARRKAVIRAVRSDPLTHRIKDDFQDMTALDLLKIVDARKRLVEQATGLLHILDLPDVRAYCTHCPRYDQDRGGFGSLKPYLRQALTATPFSDVLTSIETMARFGLRPASHVNAMCSDCLRDSSLFSGHRQRLSSLVAQLDQLVNAL